MSHHRALTLLSTASAVIALCSGCSQPVTVARQTPQPKPRIQPTFTVFGEVQRTGTFLLPRTGMSLLQGLNYAGGPTIDRSKAAAYLVRLRRDYDVYYFPLFMVESNLAGEIQLAGADEVSVVQAANTVFNTPLQDIVNNRAISVRGMVNRPNRYNIDPEKQTKINTNAPSKKPWEPFVASVEKGLLVSLDSTIVVWSRQDTSTGIRSHHWVIPTSGFGVKDYLRSVETSIGKAQIRVLGGDDIEFSQLQKYPLVLSGLIAPVFKSNGGGR